MTLVSLHNLKHYMRLMETMRRAIIDGRFREFVAEQRAIPLHEAEAEP